MEIDRCPICLEHDEKFGNCVMCSSCGHFVCGHCIAETFKNGLECCPQCREFFYESYEKSISNLNIIINKNDDRNSLFAKAMTGFLHYSHGNFEKAREFMEEPSRKGYKGTANKLGKCYLHGLGGPVDYKRAKECFLTSMDVPSSIFQLGIMYQQGKGVRKNYRYGASLKRIGKSLIGHDAILHCKTGNTIFV